ncbi:hypothetical protein BDQ17DRAFT_1324448 [Cyathus striatus]|nr:hypothetical protein BDQ17DRAFT_1324448 [Cyathus striatus]
MIPGPDDLENEGTFVEVRTLSREAGMTPPRETTPKSTTSDGPGQPSPRMKPLYPPLGLASSESFPGPSSNRKPEAWDVLRLKDETRRAAREAGEVWHWYYSQQGGGYTTRQGSAGIGISVGVGISIGARIGVGVGIRIDWCSGCIRRSGGARILRSILVKTQHQNEREAEVDDESTTDKGEEDIEEGSEEAGEGGVLDGAAGEDSVGGVVAAEACSDAAEPPSDDIVERKRKEEGIGARKISTDFTSSTKLGSFDFGSTGDGWMNVREKGKKRDKRVCRTRRGAAQPPGVV